MEWMGQERCPSSSSGPKVSLACPSPPLEDATWQGEIRRVAIAFLTFAHVKHSSWVETVSTFTFPKPPTLHHSESATEHSCQKACWVNGPLALPATKKANDEFRKEGPVMWGNSLSIWSPWSHGATRKISPGSWLGNVLFHMENFKTRM